MPKKEEIYENKHLFLLIYLKIHDLAAKTEWPMRILCHSIYKLYSFILLNKIYDI